MITKPEIPLEQQPTASIVLDLRNLDQQPTLPISISQRRSSTMLRWLIPSILCVLLLGGVLTGRATIQSLFSSVFLHGDMATQTIHAHHRNVLAHSSLIDEAAQRFMDAMMQKNWSLMWSMLSPDAQQSWQGEKDFVHFEQAKFGSLKLIAYKNSPSQIQQDWLNPDTTRAYASVATMSVTLQATAPEGLLTTPSMQALHAGLFNNTLLALVQNKGTWKILVAGPADQDAPILVPAKTLAVKLLVPIFMYHHISNQPTTNLLDYNLTVTATDFDQQLTWLQQQGYTSITQTELFDAFYYGKALPAHPMILSFDDGYEDVYSDALPVLLAHHYRGVFYIITGMIGGNYMTWDQVRTLARDGMQISSHTIHHIDLANPPSWTSPEAELSQSQATLQAQLHRPIQFFCYPSGEPFHHGTFAQQQLILSILFKDGYVGATLDPLYFNSAVQDVQTPYQLQRIRVSGGESLQDFMGILTYTLNVGAGELGQR